MTDIILKMVTKEDEIIVHSSVRCSCCGKSFDEIWAFGLQLESNAIVSRNIPNETSYEANFFVYFSLSKITFSCFKY